MPRLLILYSTTDGHTPHICARLQRVLEPLGHRVVVKPLAEAGAADLASCGRVVIGASIRYGKHQPQVAAFITRHQAAIEARPNAFFSVNVVARKPGKDEPETNPYLRKFLTTITWKPQRLAVFAGKIDYPRYGFVDRHMIRVIMWMTKGPTDLASSVEFTDWAKVEAFGRSLVQAPGTAPPPAPAAG